MRWSGPHGSAHRQTTTLQYQRLGLLCLFRNTVGVIHFHQQIKFSVCFFKEVNSCLAWIDGGVCIFDTRLHTSVWRGGDLFLSISLLLILFVHLSKTFAVSFCSPVLVLFTGLVLLALRS